MNFRFVTVKIFPARWSIYRYSIFSRGKLRYFRFPFSFIHLYLDFSLYLFLNLLFYIVFSLSLSLSPSCLLWLSFLLELLSLLSILPREKSSITINVPVVYMARDVMILMRENSFRGHWKGWVLKIETLSGPEMATSEVSAIWAQKKLKSWSNLPPFSLCLLSILPYYFCHFCFFSSHSCLLLKFVHVFSASLFSHFLVF